MSSNRTFEVSAFSAELRRSSPAGPSLETVLRRSEPRTSYLLADCKSRIKKTMGRFFGRYSNEPKTLIYINWILRETEQQFYMASQGKVPYPQPPKFNPKETDAEERFWKRLTTFEKLKKTLKMLKGMPLLRKKIRLPHCRLSSNRVFQLLKNGSQTYKFQLLTIEPDFLLSCQECQSLCIVEVRFLIGRMLLQASLGHISPDHGIRVEQCQ